MDTWSKVVNLFSWLTWIYSSRLSVLNGNIVNSGQF